MRIAIFSDVHGNLPALLAFMSATHRSVDRYINLGDTVGYGPWPDQCAEIVHEICAWRVCEGNHERLHLGTERIEKQISLVQTFYRHTYLLFTATHLIKGRADYLTLYGHLFQHIDDGNAPALVGHSHRQQTLQTAHGPIIHVGSIGQNRTAIDVAEWAELDTETGQVTLRRKTYPFDKLVAEMRSRHYPDECIDYYTRKPRAP